MGWTPSVYGVSGLGEATVHQHCLVQQQLSGKSRDGGLWDEQGRKRQARPRDACVLGRSQSVTGTWAGAGWLLVTEGLAMLIVDYMHSSLTHDTMNALSLRKRPESEFSLPKTSIVAASPAVMPYECSIQLPRWCFLSPVPAAHDFSHPR